MNQTNSATNLPLEFSSLYCCKLPSSTQTKNLCGEATAQPVGEPPVEENRPTSRKAENSDLILLNGGKCVVVIDDEPSIVSLLKQFLGLYGVDVKGFTNAEHAVDWYRDNFLKVALIFLDMKMPVMSGKQCFYKLKNVNEKARVILMSGFVESHIVADLLARGAERFVQKPFDFPTLTDWTLQQLARKTRARSIKLSNINHAA